MYPVVGFNTRFCVKQLVAQMLQLFSVLENALIQLLVRGRTNRLKNFLGDFQAAHEQHIVMHRQRLHLRNWAIRFFHGLVNGVVRQGQANSEL